MHIISLELLSLKYFLRAESLLTEQMVLLLHKSKGVWYIAMTVPVLGNCIWNKVSDRDYFFLW